MRRLALVWVAVGSLWGCAGLPPAATSPSSGPRTTGTTGAGSGPGTALAILEGGVLERGLLVRAVLERNPGIEVARQAWRLAAARVAQESAWEDPMVRYDLAPLSGGAGHGGRYGEVAEISQRVAFPGKLGLRGDVAVAEAEAAREDGEAVRLDLALMASNLFDDHYVAARSLDIQAQHLALLEDLKRSAQAQYAAGRAAQQDPLEAEVEVAQLLQERIGLETARDVIVAQLNGLLHRPARALLPPPPAELALPTGTAEPARDPRERDEALEGRPELRRADARIRAAGSSVALAEREYFPDFTLSGGYDSMWDMPEHRAMLGIGLSLPIQLGRRRAAVDEAEARLARERRERDRIEDAVGVEVFEARARVVAARRVLKIYEERLLPAVSDQVAAARSGFETGRSTFASLIEAERSQRSIALRYHIARADLSKRLAGLERARGRIAGGAY